MVGRDKNDPIVGVANEMVERVRRYFPIEVVEVKEEPLRKSSPVDRVKRAEADRLRATLKAGERLIALDERGTMQTSEELAKRLARAARDGRSLAFVIGGPSGLDAELVEEADERWSLSKMTLPHRIARLVLSEQLYRAASILRGEPYHK